MDPNHRLESSPAQSLDLSQRHRNQRQSFQPRRFSSVYALRRDPVRYYRLARICLIRLIDELPDQRRFRELDCLHDLLFLERYRPLDRSIRPLQLHRAVDHQFDHDDIGRYRC